MKILCSKTGSDGNFSIISCGKDQVVIDCGIPWEKANRMSGYTLIDSDLVLVDHCHTDHAEFVQQFLKKGMTVYATKETWEKDNTPSFYSQYMRTIDGSQIRAGDSTIIKPFRVPHINSDGSDCENYGFLIYDRSSNERMLWITDCSYVEQQFPPCEYICIECNYVDVDDYTNEIGHLNATIENRRVWSHLSLNRCVDFLKKQDLSKIKFVKLLHLTKSQGKIEDTIADRFRKEFPELEVII